MVATMEEMVAAVKAHAQANYGKDGWDTIVECYEDDELAKLIEDNGSTTVAEAIREVGEGCKVRADYEADIRAEGGWGPYAGGKHWWEV